MEEEKPLKKAAKKPAAKRTAKKAAAAPPSQDQKTAAEIIESGPSKFLMFMKRGASYTTPSGVTFNKAHPFQLVEFGERESLLNLAEERFEDATPEQAKAYYNK